MPFRELILIDIYLRAKQQIPNGRSFFVIPKIASILTAAWVPAFAGTTK
jgi:hypothetical protein